MDDPRDDPRGELEQLTLALTAELRRRRALGLRSVARALPASGPSPAPAAPAAPATKPAPTAPTAPTAPIDAGDSEPAQPAPVPAAQVAPSAPPPAAARPPAEARPAGGGSDLAERVAAMRVRAAGLTTLEELRAEVAGCSACSLCETRSQTVFADGRGTRGVLFVGEAPGYHEDVQGVPFVGRAGQLLTDIIEKGMRLTRDEVTICNVLKCRPPENRDPSAEEKALCTTWLDRQIELCDPRVIIPLGRHAAGHLLGSDAPMGRLRGRVHERDGRKVVATYHPAYLLRSPEMKRACWEDIQLAMRELGLPPQA